MMATEGDGSENEEFEWEEKAEEAYRGKDVSATIDAADGIRAHEYILDQSSRSSKGTLWAASLKLSPALHAALLEEQGRSRSAAYGESMSIEFQSKDLGTIHVGSARFDFKVSPDIAKEIYVLEPRSVGHRALSASGRYKLRCSTVGKLILGGGSEDFRVKYTVARANDAAASQFDARTTKSAVIVESASQLAGPSDRNAPAELAVKAMAPAKRKRPEVRSAELPAKPSPLGSSFSLSAFPGSIGASMKPVNHCVVLRHLPSAVTSQSICSFFGDLNLIFDGCFFVVPSSELPGVVVCPCPCGHVSSSGTCTHRVGTDRGDSASLSTSNANCDRVDVYVHFCDGNSAALALKQNGESIQYRSNNKPVNITTVVQNVTLEELCWVYLSGVIWRRGGPATALLALQQTREYMPHESLHALSLISISKYWADRGFKLANYWKIIEQIVPFCREMHHEALQTALVRGLKKKTPGKSFGIDSGSVSIDWIARKYASSDQSFSGVNCGDDAWRAVKGNTACNRMLDSDYVSRCMMMNSSSLIADARNVGSRLGSKVSVASEVVAEDLVTVRGLESHLTSVQAALLASCCCEAPMGGREVAARELALDASDRMLTLFNLIEIWVLNKCT